MTGTPAHPTRSLRDVVHQRHRLGILTIAGEAERVERVEFTVLRDALGLTAGNLSRHLSVLEEAGLVRVEKGYEGRRPRTWVHLTRAGRRALAEEMSALRALVSRHEAVPRTGSPPATPSGPVLRVHDAPG